MKKHTIILALFLLTGTLSYGQPDEGNPGSSPAPFGFVELLVAAGAALGGKKIYDAKKKSEN